MKIFNFEPLDKLWTSTEKSDNKCLKSLIQQLRGRDDCCEGNPCYIKQCLACFCRGNIRYLTTDQINSLENAKVVKRK